eukprot:253221-Chlamydomonas_euryale.AAC.1
MGLPHTLQTLHGLATRTPSTCRNKAGSRPCSDHDVAATCWCGHFVHMLMNVGACWCDALLRYALPTWQTARGPGLTASPSEPLTHQGWRCVDARCTARRRLVDLPDRVPALTRRPAAPRPHRG